MKIRGRLITAFLIIIMIPIVLITASIGIIINYQINSIQQNYNIESDYMQMLTNPMQLLNKITREIYNDIKICALKTPEKFQEEKYITEIDSELKKRYSFAVLRKNESYIFIGDEEKFSKLKNLLPAFGVYVTNSESGLYVGDKNPFLVKKEDFYFEDGGEGSIFIITDMNTLIPQLKTTTTQMIISFIIILCLTAAILTFWIYQGLLRPLNALRAATYRMKNGDLDFSIIPESEDEIGLLCEDFEDMRIRLKALIEERMQYEVDSKELISNISHDLKTPLTAIKGYTEGIIDGVADTPEKMERYLKTIYTKANDMTALVDELSFYTKIDCNTVPYSFNSINLNHYFSDCISELTLDLDVKNIDLAYFNYTDTDLEIVADPEQLKRVISNIVGNSVKYIERKKGIINIRITDTAEFVQIEIEDNGKGIAKEDLSNIFERFYRTDTSRNSSKGGSGLGLAIAKKIIEDHGGKIWADSKEGVCTIIFFTLKKAECFLKENEKKNPDENKTKDYANKSISKIKTRRKQTVE